MNIEWTVTLLLIRLPERPHNKLLMPTFMLVLVPWPQAIKHWCLKWLKSLRHLVDRKYRVDFFSVSFPHCYLSINRDSHILLLSIMQSNKVGNDVRMVILASSIAFCSCLIGICTALICKCGILLLLFISFIDFLLVFIRLTKAIIVVSTECKQLKQLKGYYLGIRHNYMYVLLITDIQP